jgi:hypothetical protein
MVATTGIPLALPCVAAMLTAAALAAASGIVPRAMARRTTRRLPASRSSF